MNPFRPEVVALEAYTLLEAPLPVKLDQNEAPWDWPAPLKEAAACLVTEAVFNRYPPFQERALTEALASRWGLSPESVLVGNGSNELLRALFGAAVGPGRTLFCPSPSFSLYGQMALLSGSRAVAVPFGEAFAYDPAAWLGAVERERPALVLVCSPNNPTGSAFALEGIERLCDCAPLVAVDEAYGEFAGESAASLLPGRENLVVLRTLSKAWGAAALRLGYAFAAPGTARQLGKALLPYGVSPLTAGLGRLALQNADLFEPRVAALRAERERVRQALYNLRGVTVFPSEANFLLLRMQGLEARVVHGALKTRGVLLRDVSRGPGLSGCLRFTVGTREENDAALAALVEVLP